MAIAFDAASSEGYKVGAVDPETYSHTCTGSNRFLAVGVFTLKASGGGPVSVTYNGTSMTQHPSSPDQYRADVWPQMFYLVAPSSGTNNVSLSWGFVPGEVASVSSSYTGVDQTTPVETTGSTKYTANTTTGSVSMTSTTNNAWFVGVAQAGSGGMAPASGETERVDDTVIQLQDFLQATAGTASLDWSWTNDKATVYGIVIREAGAGGGTTVKRSGNLLLMGVG